MKILQGNPGKRRLDPEKEPKPPKGPVEPPEMSEAARKVWDKLAPKCEEMGTLTSVDAEAFGVFCELQATLAQCSKMKGEPGFCYFIEFTTVDGAGNEHVQLKESPVIKLERNTAMALRAYYERFGLEPSSRSRIHVATKAAPVSKWAGVI